MPDITFTSARLLNFSRDLTAGSAQFAASWNQKVANVMGWGDVPDWLKKSSPEGELHASSMRLTPSEGELKKHALDLDINRVHSFEAIRLELDGSKGKGHRTELRFKIKFADPKGCQQLERYIQTIGEGKGSLTVSYTKQADLPLISEEQAAATDEDAD